MGRLRQAIASCVVDALLYKQRNDLECAELATAIGYRDAARSFEEEFDQAQRLITLFEDSDSVTVSGVHDTVV